MPDHYTKVADEGKLVQDGPDAVEEARRLHHLASADPEPERDGKMTGPAHEEKYGLERADASAALWRGAGVHPIANRALHAGEDGAENLRGAVGDEGGGKAIETTEGPRAAKK